MSLKELSSSSESTEATQSTSGDGVHVADHTKDSEAVRAALNDAVELNDFVQFVNFIDFLQTESPAGTAAPQKEQEEDGITWSDIMEGKAAQDQDGETTSDKSDVDFAAFLKSVEGKKASAEKYDAFVQFMNSPSTKQLVSAKKNSVEDEEIWSEIVRGMSDTQRMGFLEWMTTTKSDAAEDAAPSWFGSLRSWFGAAPVAVQPEGGDDKGSGVAATQKAGDIVMV